MAALVEKQVLPVVVLFIEVWLSSGNTDTHLTRNVSTTVLCMKRSDSSPAVDGGRGWLVHSVAHGEHDELHYLVSTRGTPAVLVARTSPGADLSVNCGQFLNDSHLAGSVNLSKAHYAYGLMFNRLLEYNDTKDVADLDKVPADNSTWNNHNLQDLMWVDAETMLSLAHNEIAFKVDQSTDSLKFFENGSLSITLKIHGEYERDSALPHLERNANSSSLELRIDRVNCTFSHARFALEMTLVTDQTSHPMAYKSVRSIDDEHSPGVFELIDWTSNGEHQTRSGYLQFKPVCYTSPDRDLNSATKAVHYPLHTPKPDSQQPVPSILYAYFGDRLYDGNLSLTMANVSFGLPLDKFYTKTNYMIWTATVGFGVPPTDEVSLVIIIILSVGLGLPLALITFGSVGICVKKKVEQRRSGLYTEISADAPGVN